MAANDRPGLEAALEGGEVIADALMHGDVLADVPVIGTAFKLLKAADTIRDRAFATKLSRFLFCLGGVSSEMRDRLRKKVSESPDEAKKVGETLLLILERMTDLDKPTVLAQVFLAYVDGIVSSQELRRLCQAVDDAFADDLVELVALHRVPEKSEANWMQYLSASGLTKVISGSTWDDTGKLFFEISPLGHKFRTAYFHGRKQSKRAEGDG